MNILELRVAGLRGFDDRQTIEVGGQLVVPRPERCRQDVDR